MPPAASSDRRGLHDRLDLSARTPARKALVSPERALPVGPEITFVEGVEPRAAAGILFGSTAMIGMLAAAGMFVLVTLTALEVLPGLMFSVVAPPGSPSGDPPGVATVARSTNPPPGGFEDRAARSAGDVGPRAHAPEVAPVLPALGAATPVPREEDGPPEESLERAR